MWNGCSTQDGTLGLVTRENGVLDLVNLKTGEPVKTLIPRQTQVSVEAKMMFAADYQYVVHYHVSRNLIRLFCTTDSKSVKLFYPRAKITSITLPRISSLASDDKEYGRYITLMVRDPSMPDTTSRVSSLPPRQHKKSLSAVFYPRQNLKAQSRNIKLRKHVLFHS